MSDSDADTRDAADGAAEESRSAAPDSSASSGSRRWNLGKDRSKKVEVKAPKPLSSQPPRPLAPPRPAAPPVGGGAKLAIPRQGPSQRPDTESDTSIVIPGRPVPRPRNAREWMNHPLTIIASGLAICISAVIWVTFFFGGPSAENTTDTVTLTDESRVGSGVINATGQGKKDETGEVIAAPTFDIGEEKVREGRMILGTGEMLIAVANFMARGSKPSSELAAEFVPMAIMSAPLPSPDSIQFNIARAQQATVAQDLVDIGAGAIESARARGVAPDRIRRVGTRLVAEGLAVLDSHLGNQDARRMVNEAMPQVGLPGIDGAAQKVSSVQADVATQEIRDLLVQIVPAYYAEEFMTVRARHFQ